MAGDLEDHSVIDNDVIK